MERDSNDFPILKKSILRAMAPTKLEPGDRSLLSEIRRTVKQDEKAAHFTDSDFLYVVCCLIEDGKIKIVELQDVTWQGDYGNLIVDPIIVIART